MKSCCLCSWSGSWNDSSLWFECSKKTFFLFIVCVCVWSLFFFFLPSVPHLKKQTLREHTCIKYSCKASQCWGLWVRKCKPPISENPELSAVASFFKPGVGRSLLCICWRRTCLASFCLPSSFSFIFLPILLKRKWHVINSAWGLRFGEFCFTLIWPPC